MRSFCRSVAATSVVLLVLCGSATAGQDYPPEASVSENVDHEARIFKYRHTDVGDFEPNTNSTMPVAPELLGEVDRESLEVRRPDQIAAHLFSTGLSKHAHNDYAGAIANYLQAISCDDWDPAVHWYLGSAYQSTGRLDEARIEFEKEKELAAKTRSRVSAAPRRKIMNLYGNGYYSNSNPQGRGIGDFGSDSLYFTPGVGLTKYPATAPKNQP